MQSSCSADNLLNLGGSPSGIKENATALERDSETSRTSLVDNVDSFTNNDVVNDAMVDCDLRHEDKLDKIEFRMWLNLNPGLIEFIESSLPIKPRLGTDTLSPTLREANHEQRARRSSSVVSMLGDSSSQTSHSTKMQAPVSDAYLSTKGNGGGLRLKDPATIANDDTSSAPPSPYYRNAGGKTDIARFYSEHVKTNGNKLFRQSSVIIY
jgi:hypothetical protein